LDTFLRNRNIEAGYQVRMFSDNFGGSGNPINKISDSALIAWSDCDPEICYPLIAAAIQPFSFSTETKDIAWKPIIHSIFEKAPNIGIILKHLAHAIKPSSWSGSLADILQTRSVLFQSLYQHHNPEIQDWAKEQYRDLQATIETWRVQEDRQNRRRNESFE
jgi:hypothetical protein